MLEMSGFLFLRLHIFNSSIFVRFHKILKCLKLAFTQIYSSVVSTLSHLQKLWITKGVA